jgi:hypothetical protein
VPGGIFAGIAEQIQRHERIFSSHLKKSVEGPVNDLASDIKVMAGRVGQQLIFGIIEGVNDMKSLLTQILKAVASMMINVLLRRLGVFSPSKKGIYIGEMLGRGVQAGILKSIPGVYGASAGLAAVAGAGPAMQLSVDTSGLQRPMGYREAALQSEVINLFVETFKNAQSMGSL